jgi:hypothetical protein
VHEQAKSVLRGSPHCYLKTGLPFPLLTGLYSNRLCLLAIWRVEIGGATVTLLPIVNHFPNITTGHKGPQKRDRFR